MIESFKFTPPQLESQKYSHLSLISKQIGERGLPNGFQKPVIRSYKLMEEAILQHSFAIGSWKYYYEDFKHLKAAILEEIQLFSINKLSDHLLKQQIGKGPPGYFYSVPHTAAFRSHTEPDIFSVKQPRLVELLQKEFLLDGIEKNLRF